MRRYARPLFRLGASCGLSKLKNARYSGKLFWCRGIDIPAAAKWATNPIYSPTERTNASTRRPCRGNICNPGNVLMVVVVDLDADHGRPALYLILIVY